MNLGLARGGNSKATHAGIGIGLDDRDSRRWDRAVPVREATLKAHVAKQVLANGAADIDRIGLALGQRLRLDIRGFLAHGQVVH